MCSSNAFTEPMEARSTATKHRAFLVSIFPSPAAVGLIIYEVKGYKYVKKRKQGDHLAYTISRYGASAFPLKFKSYSARFRNKSAGYKIVKNQRRKCINTIWS